MRITIDTDQSDRVASSTDAIAAGFDALDGGPAPVAELRRTGRLPDAGDTAPAPAEASEGGHAPLNPLRYGAQVAAAQDE